MQELDVSSVFPHIVQGWLSMTSLGDGGVHTQERDPRPKQTLGAPLPSEQAKVVEKQKAEFSQFLLERQDRLLGVAYRMLRDREAALDVLQEVALTLFQHWDSLDREQNIDGWLYRVMVHACYRWLRNKPSFDAFEQTEHLGDSTTRTPQEAYLRTLQFQAFLREALEQLSEQERIAFLLRDIEQRPGKEIAALMGCQGTTARGYYFSARKKLAAYIEQQAPEWLSLLGQGEAGT